jgi:hypothetical protein
VFLVGSGVEGSEAPVGLAVSTVGLAFASFGVTPGVLSEPGDEGSAGFSAITGVPARSNVANKRAKGALFIGQISYLYFESPTTEAL